MASSKFQGVSISATCLSLAVHGCGPDGARAPDLFVVAPEDGVPAPEREPDANMPLLPPGQSTPPPSTPSANPDAACATASAAVEIVARPVDIIVALDNSGSMDDEARAVEA